jgi:hypothetical protein
MTEASYPIYAARVQDCQGVVRMALELESAGTE